MLLELLFNIIRNPFYVSILCCIYVFSYYVVSAFFIKYSKIKNYIGVWRKNGVLDVVTSVLWFLVAIILVWSLIELTIKYQLSLSYLILYYFFFIFLFGFLYGILEWHFPGMLENTDANTWEAELRYIIVSVQTMTTLGYTRSKPSKAVIELIASIQALLGLFFVAIFIAKAVAYWSYQI